MRWLLFGTVAMALPAMLVNLRCQLSALSAMALTFGSVCIGFCPFMPVFAMRSTCFCPNVVLLGGRWLKVIGIDATSMLAFFTTGAFRIQVMTGMIEHQSCWYRPFVNQKRLPVDPASSDFSGDCRGECDDSVAVPVQSTSPQPTTIFGYGHIGEQSIRNGRFIEMLHRSILPRKASYGRI